MQEDELRRAMPSEKALERAWVWFLDANPDDVTSPEEYPDHALVTFRQLVGIVEEAALTEAEEHAALQSEPEGVSEAMLKAGFREFNQNFGRISLDENLTRTYLTMRSASLQSDAQALTEAGELTARDVTDDMLNAGQSRLCELRCRTFFDDELQAEIFAAMFNAMRSAAPPSEQSTSPEGPSGAVGKVHWKDRVYFERTDDGTVIVTLGGNFDGGGYELFAIDRNSWASIVASVSAEGEDSGRFYEALRFHGEPDDASPKMLSA